MASGPDGDRRALVTGATRGIGKATAIALAEAGWDVAITGRTVRAGEVITIDGSKGEILLGAVNMIEPELTGDFATLMAWADKARRLSAPAINVPDKLAVTITPTMATQTGFGALLNEIGRGDREFAQRIVTTSPDVTVSTSLGPWVNRRGLFARATLADTFKSERIPSTFNWEYSPKGQHLELGIAEMNLFLALGAAGLTHSLFGERLIPIAIQMIGEKFPGLAIAHESILFEDNRVWSSLRPDFKLAFADLAYGRRVAHLGGKVADHRKNALLLLGRCALGHRSSMRACGRQFVTRCRQRATQ